MRNYKAAGAFAVITVALILQAGGVAAGDSSRGASEYELMSLLIREQYGSEFRPILIGRDTESSYLRENLGSLKKIWPGLKSETIDSLIVNYGAAPRRLEEQFALPVEYRLMTDNEYMDILRVEPRASKNRTLAAGLNDSEAGLEVQAAIDRAAAPNWDEFDTLFPDAQGYLIFSRVAFDAERAQALVVFSNAYRCSGIRTKPPTREIAFFSKEDGAWILVGVSRGIQAAD